MPEAHFQISRRRDAWGSILGYVYQVDLTILRWLQLSKTELLILEHGEDIDHIQESLPQTRLLEQVKVRRRNLTLQSEIVREALASFCEHKEKNPSLDLRFRFFTTARPANERPRITNLEAALSGLHTWEAIRNGTIRGAAAEKAAGAILAFLRKKRRPPSVPESTWRHFLSLTGHLNRAGMLDLIKQVEWAIAAPGPSDLVSQVKRHLLTSSAANTEEEAVRKHEHLFFHVFRLLTNSNRGPLSLEDLQRELAAHEPTDEEATLHEQIRHLRQYFGDEFGALRVEVRRGFSEMRSRFDEFSRKPEDNPSPNITQNTSDLVRIFGNASTALLSWPQETSGHWIERPQLEELVQLISSDDSTLSVLAGPPGSGKSAILSRLGVMLSDQNLVLLAIKADLLPRDLKSLSDLDETLGLDSPLSACIAGLAKLRTTVLLIDQLDALSELMDLHTSRLSILLSLINRIRALQNVHVIVSCREFELRHDTRLARLAGHIVRLGPYPWPEVSKLLERKGVASDHWPQDAKDVLCVAQNLSMFMDHFSEEDPVFETYQAMMEALWEKIEREHGHSATTACEQLAAAVAESEELWVPISLFDDARSQISQLEGASVLVRQSSGRKIGFRHQTLFEFIRARMFTKEEGSLADYLARRQDALFVRPTIWHALHYLRSADRKAYVREFQKLWMSSDLRLHVKDLLITFLGQQQLPTTFETSLLVPLIENTSSRQRALRSVEGSAGWFSVLERRFPALMTESERSARMCSEIFRAAMTFAEESVLRLIENNWFSRSEFDSHIVYTLRETPVWSQRHVDLVVNVVNRQPLSRSWIAGLADIVLRSAPELAPQIVSAQFSAELREARQKAIEEPDKPPKSASELEHELYRIRRRDARKRPFEDVLSDSGWYGISGLAEQVPEQFLECVWPVFKEICRALSEARTRDNRYVESKAFELDDEYLHAGRALPIVDALRAAVRKLAVEQTPKFRAFLKREGRSNLMAVHCILARGLAEEPSVLALDTLDYLLGDARRLALGARGSQARTIALIESAAKFWEPHRTLELETAITNWNLYAISAGDDVHRRRHKRKWNRQSRLVLLRAFTKMRLSPGGWRLLEEEERALPGTTDLSSVRVTGGFVGSPLSAAQMERAKDHDILRLFEELEDGTNWDHPKSSRRGGSIPAAREFAKFAANKPRRALRLIRKFKRGRQERPAGEALEAIARQRCLTPETILTSIHELNGRGFCSEDFRRSVAQALFEIAGEQNGLNAPTCSLLTSWLQVPRSDSADTDQLDEKAERSRGSILWGSQVRTIAAGNYKFLAALTRGLLCRKPPAYDLWLTVLEKHLKYPERVEVWASLTASDLQWLRGVTQPTRAIAFLVDLFGAYPRALSSFDGALFLAHSHQWLPEEKLHEWMTVLLEGSWPDGPQAVGELAMYRRARVPGDKWCASLVDSVAEGRIDDQDRLVALRTGIAHSAVNLWTQSAYRTLSGNVIRQLIPTANEDLAEVLSWSLDQSEETPIDSETTLMLPALASNPAVLASLGKRTSVTRLSDYLAAGIAPPLIASFAMRLIETLGHDIGDYRLGWHGTAGPLIDLSLTLQRCEETRKEGLTMFERLLEYGAYEAEKVLREDIDRRL